MKRESQDNSPAYDKAGIASAVLCTIHCLLIPVLVTAKYWWGQNASIVLPSWWSAIDYLFLLISFLAVYHSAGHTSHRDLKISLWAFWLVLAVAILFEATLHWLTYIASAGLITSHFINIRRSRATSTPPAFE